MRDFPSCFGENGVQVADAACSRSSVSKGSQNSVSCVYQCRFNGKSFFISIVWTKTLMGQCLSVELDDASHHFISKVDVKPSLFSKRRGSKSLEVTSSSLIEVFWDLSSAKFGSGPEPLEGYYIAVVFKGAMVLVIGDLKREAFKKTGANAYSLSNALFISKKEHAYGKRTYGTKAQFYDNGPVHDLEIECSSDDDRYFVVRIDAKTVMQIEHLEWKFRGNRTILVDGLPVEVFWDVHNWLFCTGITSALFMFQTNLSAEKLWTSPSLHDSSVFSWNCSDLFKDSKLSGLGFTLFLYAWKNE